MVSAGRVACVSIPLMLTLGSIITLAILFGAASKPGSTHSVYYFKVCILFIASR